MKIWMITAIAAFLLGSAIGMTAAELQMASRRMPPDFPSLTHQQLLDALEKSGYSVSEDSRKP